VRLGACGEPQIQKVAAMLPLFSATKVSTELQFGT
jgi:hypothetical protein